MDKATVEARTRRRKIPLYIGLTGSMGSGKGEVASCFENLHFNYISLSDIVREEIKKIDNIDRSAIQNIGNKLREQGGPSILASRVIAKIRASGKKNWVIDGIRNPAEVQELKKLHSFYLIGIKSHMRFLLERIISRKRETDRIKISELKKTIKREWGTGEPENGQQVGKCMKMADHILENNGSLEELRTNCEKILSAIEGEHAR
jgi:dephospho-CoA kinase